MLTLHDAALLMGLVAVLLALWGWPRLSMVLSVGSVFYTVQWFRIRRWQRRTGGD